ncbi:DUF6480 family protein [Streptomyces sp. NPDC005728]|uniref:DUF6480 family protein n=1 Tax=Streptomyces sp. NPDC005728 TaxID=3157054 RepID=UPI0033DAD3CA
MTVSPRRGPQGDVQILQTRLDQLCPRTRRLTAGPATPAEKGPTVPGLPEWRAGRDKPMMSADPEPTRTAGLEAGAGRPPGEAPRVHAARLGHGGSADRSG